MSSVVLQVRVDEETKKSASEIYKNIGMDLSTAVRIFLKQTIREQGLPLRTNLAYDDRGRQFDFEKAVRIREKRQRRYSTKFEKAWRDISEEAKSQGLDKMTLEEINAEIDASRKHRA